MVVRPAIEGCVACTVFDDYVVPVRYEAMRNDFKRGRERLLNTGEQLVHHEILSLNVCDRRPVPIEIHRMSSAVASDNGPGLP